MEGIVVYSLTILAGALGAIILCYFTKNVKLSCLLAPIVIELAGMLYYYLTEGAISQFGPLPYIIIFPFLLAGSIAGSIFWVTTLKNQDDTKA